MRIHYMNGAGNDFMVMDARGNTFDFEALAVKFCAKTGADGFMAVDTAENGDFKLHFYNSDGSRGEMCGNGARCISRFAFELGIAGETMTIETDSGPVLGWRLAENRYRVQLPNPTNLDLARKEAVAYVEVGCPHAVTEYRGDLRADAPSLKESMRKLRFDPAFPKGANVNLYTWLNETAVQILTFERGVEDFTLACGTGSGAVATVLWASGKVPGGFLTVENPGGSLAVTISGENGRVDRLLLEGPAEVTRIYDWEALQ
jgi:diaminopimelate epimerase